MNGSAEVRREVAETSLVSVLGKELSSTPCQLTTSLRVELGQVGHVLPLGDLTNLVDIIHASVHLELSIIGLRLIPLVEPAEPVERYGVLNHVSQLSPDVSHVEQVTVHSIKGKVANSRLEEELLPVHVNAGAQHHLHEGIVPLSPGSRPASSFSRLDRDHVESVDLVRQAATGALLVKGPVLHLKVVDQGLVLREGDVGLLMILSEHVGSNLLQSKEKLLIFNFLFVNLQWWVSSLLHLLMICAVKIVNTHEHRDICLHPQIITVRSFSNSQLL